MLKEISKIMSKKHALEKESVTAAPSKKEKIEADIKKAQSEMDTLTEMSNKIATIRAKSTING